MKLTPSTSYFPEPDFYYTSPTGYSAMMRWYDRILATLPVVSHCISTRYGETHVLTAGQPDAPPLVLLHGINVSALNWKAQILRLAQEYHLIVPDVIGFAGKSVPVRLPYTGTHYADWLCDVLDAFKVERAVLAGSSGGGYYVLKLAAVYPERAAGLALINPCGISRYPLPQDLFRYQWVVNLVGEIGRRFFATRQGARRLVRASASPGIELNPETVEMAYLLVKYFRRFPPPGPLPASELSRVRAPILLLLGDHEPYFNLRTLLREARRRLINAEITTIIVPNAGHDIHNDQAEVVSKHLHRFLQMVLYAPPRYSEIIPAF